MRDLIVVVAACIGVAICTLLHKYGGSLCIGVGVGAVYFLKAVATGGGIADVQIGTLTNPRRKPIDPAGSIGMGLAASGIAAAAMGSPDYMLALGHFLPVAVVLGLLIALGYSIFGLKQQSVKVQAADDDKTRPDQSNVWRN